MSRRRWLVAAGVALACFLVLGRYTVGILAEWSWYEAMGALPLYRSRLLHELVLRGGSMAAAFAFALANLYAVRRSVVSLVLPRRMGNIEIGEAVPGRYLTWSALAIAALLALALVMPSGEWTTFALSRFGESFGEVEPYLDHDIGAYVYGLPFERLLYLWSMVALIIVSAVVVVLYAVTPSLRMERGRLYVSAYVRRHVAVLAGLLLLAVAWSYRLDTMTLLVSGGGAGSGFSSFDHRVVVPLLTGLSYGAAVASVVVAWAAWHGYHRVTLAIVGALVIAGPVARLVLPRTDALKVSARDLSDREKPYDATRLLFTRRAFALEQLVDADSAGVTPPTIDALAPGVPAWDVAALTEAAAAQRRGASVIALAWHPTAPGLDADVVLKNAPASGGTPQYTVASYDAVSADERGYVLPAIGQPDQPAAISGRPLAPLLVEPSVPDVTIAADSTGRVRGAPFETFGQRVVHAWRMQNPRLLAAEPPAPHATVHYHRELRDRIAALAPFFVVGRTVQAIVRGDSLYWVAELFVGSEDYPLSDAIAFGGGSVRYLRHAATAVVQAQTGRVHLVPDAQPDPVTRSWMKHYPWLFEKPSALPAGLDALWPPAVDWAAAQANALVKTGLRSSASQPLHMATPNEPLVESFDAPPTLTRLAGPAGALAWSRAVLDADDRVMGVVVARGGEMPRTEWHRAAGTLRWRVALDEVYKAAVAGGLGGPARSTARRGGVQALPTKDGVALVQPWFDAPPDQPPALAGVAVTVGDRLKAGPTLLEALGAARARPVAGTEAFRAKVTAAYEAMRTAMQKGDWAAFGVGYRALGGLIGR